MFKCYFLIVLVLFNSDVFSSQWLGEWTSTFGEIQIIEKVTDYKGVALVYGNYDKNGFLTGVSIDNKLYGVFFDPKSKKNGSFVFTMNKANKTFEGLWYFDDIDKELKWNGMRLSSQTNLTLSGIDRYRSIEGIWDTNFGKLQLTQESVFIEGKYDTKGKLYGVFSYSNNLMYGFFTNKNKFGMLKFTLNKQRTSFDGVWSWQTGKWEKQEWKGRKTSKLQ